jgi:hypothetical protein
MDSLLDLHLDQVPDLVPVPGNEQYQLRVTSAAVGQSASSERQLIKVALKVLGHPEAQTVFENFSLPIPSDPPDHVDMFKRNLKNFITACGIDPKNPGKPEDWQGAEPFAILKLKTNEKSGAEENKVGRWIIPQA